MLGITKEQLMQLPEVHYPGKVILVNSAAKAKSALKYLNKMKQVGFDTETRPSFQKNHRYKVSLVQISTLDGECFLFRLKEMGSLDGLFSFFENPSVQKIGLSIKDDFHSLQKLADFSPANFVELQTFVKDYQIADNSLQKIYGIIFNERISKNQRLTNWEAKELTPGQQAYAALDAWACQKIYNHLIAGSFNPEESPYDIDDETAQVLQRSVGIHPAVPCDSVHPAEGESNTEPTDNAEPKKKKKKKKKKKAEAQQATETEITDVPASVVEVAVPATPAIQTEVPADTVNEDASTAKPKKSRYKTHSEEIAELKERLSSLEGLIVELTRQVAALAPKPRKRQNKQKP